VKTQGAGGDGAALVSAEAPAEEFYKFTAEDQTIQYVQRVIFTPNDQTNIYRDGLVEADEYDKDPEYYNNIVLFPEQTTAYTNHTGVDSYLWNVKASTRYYAISVGQNNKGEWGEICKSEFTTPDASKAQELQGEAKPKAVVAGVSARQYSATTTVSNGAVAPKALVKGGITMTVK
jgi:fibronectin type III domain protein